MEGRCKGGSRGEGHIGVDRVWDVVRLSIVKAGIIEIKIWILEVVGVIGV